MTSATVFKIQRYCIDDGPGIRTTVFLKGCPLSCQWCHNPEGLSSDKLISFDKNLCINCGGCVAVCPKGAHSISDDGHVFDRAKCITCGKCAEICPRKALEIVGKTMTAQQVIDVVERDLLFYKKSNGGLTVSGGEPLLHYEFLIELLELAKQRGIHTAVETSSFAKTEIVERVAAYTDLFLCDFKESNSELHKEFTGVDNTVIRKNIKRIDELGKALILRCPLIPERNFTPEHIEGIAEFAKGLQNLKEIELEPYHSFGLSKRERVGVKTVYGNKSSMEISDAEAAAEQIRKTIPQINVVVRR